MDSKFFSNEDIWDILKEDFFNAKCLDNNLTWKKYLDDKNLGIGWYATSSYHIIDEQKWLLSKIKYGI